MKIIPKFEQSDFKKSSASFPGVSGIGTCVQVAHKDGIIAVGDTKDLSLQPLYFDEAEWKAFVTGVKNGEFDHF